MVTSVSTKSKLLDAGGYIVYDDLDTSTGWERIGRHEADPAPFYLVWSKKSQNTLPVTLGHGNLPVSLSSHLNSVIQRLSPSM